MSRGRRPRVLYLAFFFPPTRASGVYRARATANHLAEAGWDVTVITPPREFFVDYLRSYDPSLEAEIDPRVVIERAGLSVYRWESDIRRYSLLRGNAPLLSRQLFETRARIGFPEAYASWVPRVVARALRSHARERFDMVVATGNPFAAFAAAWWLHRLTGLPYALDYRDAWTLDLFTEQPKLDRRAERWERRTINGAALSVFVNDALRDWHAERYPRVAERMMVVPNGWEPEILGRAEFAGPVPEDRPLRFGYVGTVTEPQPLEPLFEGWRLARKLPELANASLDIYGHLGFFPRSKKAIVARIPEDEGIGVSYQGPVAKAEIARAYRDIDILIFLAAGARYVTSGKVFEYMATGKPIVSVHAPDIAATDVLSGHPLWHRIDKLAAEDVADAMTRAARQARAMTRERFDAALAHAERYTRDNTLALLERALRRCLR